MCVIIFDDSQQTRKAYTNMYINVYRLYYSRNCFMNISEIFVNVIKTILLCNIIIIHMRGILCV